MCVFTNALIPFGSNSKNCHNFIVVSVHFALKVISSATATPVTCKYLWLPQVTKSQASRPLLCFAAYIHNGRREAALQ